MTHLRLNLVVVPVRLTRSKPAPLIVRYVQPVKLPRSGHKLKITDALKADLRLRRCAEDTGQVGYSRSSEEGRVGQQEDLVWRDRKLAENSRSQTPFVKKIADQILLVKRQAFAGARNPLFVFTFCSF